MATIAYIAIISQRVKESQLFRSEESEVGFKGTRRAVSQTG